MATFRQKGGSKGQQPRSDPRPRRPASIYARFTRKEDVRKERETPLEGARTCESSQSNSRLVCRNKANIVPPGTLFASWIHESFNTCRLSSLHGETVRVQALQTRRIIASLFDPGSATEQGEKVKEVLDFSQDCFSIPLNQVRHAVFFI